MRLAAGGVVGVGNTKKEKKNALSLTSCAGIPGTGQSLLLIRLRSGGEEEEAGGHSADGCDALNTR